MFDYRLGLMTGVDLPIPELQLVLHQPTIKEISMIGEQTFFTGIQMLCIKKELYIQNEQYLSQINNFQLFMSIINEKQVAEKKQCVEQVLTLLFPQYSVFFTPRSLIVKVNEENIMIDEGNFESLQQVLAECFCLKGSGQEQYNPQSAKAKEIAQKLMKARQKVAALKAEEQKGSVFSQYLSVLTVGIGSMSLDDCLNLTMYQLYDLIERYSLYINWDLDIRSRLAGAKGEKPVENWMKQIH